MHGKALSPGQMELVAERFRALGEPSRLQILHALRGGERTVSRLMDETGIGQANLSKHLQLLHRLRFVDRRKEGLNTWYRLADPSVFQLCSLVCGRIGQEAGARKKLFPAR